MIPNEHQCRQLWEKYGLSERKRKHVELVAKVARFFAQQINNVTNLPINQSLLSAAALLHDIDKNVEKLPGERHPDAGVRILTEEGMEEVAALVATHSLHTILTGLPKTWEEKLLFLADKMVKDDVIGVDARFALWNDEYLPDDEQQILNAAYPKVKELESEIAKACGIKPEQLAETIRKEYTET